jgi:hypothetical protein
MFEGTFSSLNIEKGPGGKTCGYTKIYFFLFLFFFVVLYIEAHGNVRQNENRPLERV